jgi:tetratricopeptide (TPR) repeat protein
MPDETDKKLKPEELHQLGSQFREKDNHLKALPYLDMAIVAYQKEKNYGGLVDALKDRTLTWKHLFWQSDDQVFAILAQKDAEAMLTITQAKNLKDKFHTSYFRLGEVAMLFANFPKAVEYYTKALEIYQGPVSEKGDYRYHLGEALYRTGQKSKGVETILQGIKEIEQGANEIDSFLINVWKSGAFMRLFELLRENEPEKAKRYFTQAKKIIASDERLVIRKRQLKQLAQKI